MLQGERPCGPSVTARQDSHSPRLSTPAQSRRPLSRPQPAASPRPGVQAGPGCWFSGRPRGNLRCDGARQACCSRGQERWRARRPHLPRAPTRPPCLLPALRATEPGGPGLQNTSPLALEAPWEPPSRGGFVEPEPRPAPQTPNASGQLLRRRLPGGKPVSGRVSPGPVAPRHGPACPSSWGDWPGPRETVMPACGEPDEHWGSRRARREAGTGTAGADQAAVAPAQ